MKMKTSYVDACFGPINFDGVRFYRNHHMHATSEPS